MFLYLVWTLKKWCYSISGLLFYGWFVKANTIPFTMRNIILFFTFFFWSVGPMDLVSGYRQTQNSNGPSVWWAEDNTSLSFSPKFCLLFQVEFKTHIVSFLENCLTNSRIVCGQWSRYSSSTKRLQHERKLPHNLVSIFQVENMSHGKTEKNLNIYGHSTDFHNVYTKMIILCLVILFL